MNFQRSWRDEPAAIPQKATVHPARPRATHSHPDRATTVARHGIDPLTGSSRLRTIIDRGAGVAVVTGAWPAELAAFTARRERFLLYGQHMHYESGPNYRRRGAPCWTDEGFSAVPRRRARAPGSLAPPPRSRHLLGTARIRQRWAGSTGP
ncbi:MAG: hypothetical protein ACRDRL_01555 [Sciscionella sp.]